ncbi:MAG: hypothetical protein M3Y08_01370 [Fibrobacterota bacterium]|nr:hypothetical protein [Fibrobacterota bacterium]
MRLKTHPRDNPAFLLARSLKPKGRKRVKKAVTPEAVTQDLTEQYLDALGLPWFHLPAFVLRAAFGWNPHRSGAELGAMSQAAGIVRGLPDLLIFQAGRCLPLELKADNGKMTAAQRMWRAAIGTQEARSFEAAKAIIDAWRISP